VTTQVKIFNANGAENFSKLEKEINESPASAGARIHPVNSQMATCALTADSGMMPPAIPR
jgi:hypothetical protein